MPAKIDRARARQGLDVRGGKRLCLFAQLDGVEGCRLHKDERAMPGERIACFEKATCSSSLASANAFRSRRIARNPFRTPRYDFIKCLGKRPYFVYDNDTSSGALLNVNLHGRNNCHIRSSQVVTERTQQLWVTAQRSRGIARGGQLWCSYGKGSNHFDKIADDVRYAKYAHTRVWCGFKALGVKRGKHWIQKENAADCVAYYSSRPPTTTRSVAKAPANLSVHRVRTGMRVLLPDQLLGGQRKRVVRKLHRAFVVQCCVYSQRPKPQTVVMNRNSAQELRYFVIAYDANEAVKVKQLSTCSHFDNIVCYIICALLSSLHRLPMVPWSKPTATTASKSAIGICASCLTRCASWRNTARAATQKRGRF